MSDDAGFQYIKGKLRLPNIKTCQSVLRELKAPQDIENVERLQHIVQILGEVCHNSYNKMLSKIGEDTIAAYTVACENCGDEYIMRLTKFDIPEPKHEC